MSPNVSDSPGDRMNTHNNARLTPRGREEMVGAVVDHGLNKAATARRFNTTSNTVAKWVARTRRLLRSRDRRASGGPLCAGGEPETARSFGDPQMGGAAQSAVG